MEITSGMIISDGMLVEYSGGDSDIIIPEKVKGISSAVFKDLDALHSVVLPAGLEMIDSRCFEGCINLKSVMFPDSLVSIGTSAFAGCSSLQVFRLPSGLKSIGPNAFKNCTSLKSIEIPAGVEEIHVGAFAGCAGLTSVHFAGSWTVPKTAFGKHPFMGCGKIIIHAPAGSAAESFALANGITVITTHPVEDEKRDEEKDDAADAAVMPAARPAPAKRKDAPAEKIRFVFGTPGSGKEADDAEAAAAAKAAEAAEAAKRDEEIRAAAAEKEKKEAAERHAAHLKELEDKKNRQIYDEAVLLYEQGTENSMQQAIDMLRGIEGYSDSKQKIRQYTKGLKKTKKENEQRLRAEQKKLRAEEKKNAAPKPEAEPKTEPEKKPKAEAEKPKRRFPVKAAVIILALALAAGAGAAAAHFADRSDAKTGSEDYSLTLEDFINSNDAAREQIIQSAEGTDVDISVSGNTLIYTYDLGTSNSMTPEIAESDEIKESLGETLDSNDEQFTQLCAGLEKDTGISGISVKVVFAYGDKELLTRTYTSAGKVQ